MKSNWLKKVLPHLVAVIVFLVVAVVYCRPALEGKVLSQHDITQWKGANQQSVLYKETHGHYPLWTNSMFSGMPTFLIGTPGNNFVPWNAHNILSLGLPEPIQFFFLACLAFYFLAMVLGANPYVGALGALAFAYATYNPVIIMAGHVTKMLCIAYMPALLGSVLLIFQGRYWLGAALTALTASIMIAMNHPQITYYTLLIIGVMAVYYLVTWVKKGEIKRLGMVAAISIGSILLGAATNAVVLLSNLEYQKETIRGGASELSEQGDAKSSTGLDKDYAFSYSIYPSESFVLMTPRIYGGSSDKDERGDASAAVEALRSMPAELQSQLPLTYYWGGIGYTSGPPYLGAIICFLAIMSFFMSSNQHRYWILAATILSLFMAWGEYFLSFNDLLFKYLPFYNKFRAPSMILVIPQVLFPMAAVIYLQQLWARKGDEKAWMPDFKKGLIGAGVVFALLFILYISFDYLGENERNLLKQVGSMNQPQLTQYVNDFINGLKADRKALFLTDIMKALAFSGIAAGLIWMLLKARIKPVVVTLILAVLSFGDLLAVDSKYMNSDNYLEKEENDGSAFAMTKADQQILADKGYFRVFNLSGNAFAESRTSYYHNSLGGYHAAKLRLYQDIIENQLSKSPVNIAVLNMLNTKYILVANPQTGEQTAQLNPDALGPCWLVKAIRYVPGPKEEMKALDNFQPKDTAVVQESFKSSIPFQPQWDSTASLQLVKNDNDIINYSFNAASNQFAVFSEVYYKAGWKAFIDGKEAPIVKTDYVLRGLAIPAGKHNIEFRFEPEGYLKGKQITTIASIVIGLLLLLAAFMIYKGKGKAPVASV
ncbi:YfhO family protein [Flavihumibacter rivuli]|uniref:YfhO family protein n=1 Tax=Flavihumibacter rivuli TaxID=2838156 RepID=UPI001BDE70F8|nr:YfhO family protein [Flavihumibacter rivuli]ULQ57427.1 YfhO family protein [Flavihumibacter rivuli]